MRVVDLLHEGVDPTIISEQQLHLSCSCCPALDSLSMILCPDPSGSALQPLLQLSALTKLHLQAFSSTVADVNAAVDVVAQLTHLRALETAGAALPDKATLLQFTALTALREMSLFGDQFSVCLSNKVCLTEFG